MGGPGHASWLPTNSFALRPPYQVETYLQRQPDVSFPYFALSDFGGPPYRFASFEQPMVLLSQSPSEFGYVYPTLPSVVHASDGSFRLGYPSSYLGPWIELTTEELPLGLAPVHYFGRVHPNGFFNATPTFTVHIGQDFQPALPIFPMQANDADVNDVPYTLYDENGTVIDSGMALELFYSWPTGGPAPWELVLTHDQTSIGETPSVATARLFFDLDRSDPNPPALGYLTIRQEGELTDTVTEPELAHLNFSIVDSSAVSVMELEYRIHGSSNWTALPFSPDGDGYKAPMPLDLVEDVLYDLSFTLEDAEANRLEFTVEPAFSTSTIIVSADPDLVTQPLSLSAPYPNPTQDLSIISYTLPQAGHVRMVVFDLLGREIALPVSGDQSAGTHEINLDTSKWPSGIYSVQLNTGNGQTSRRFSVIH